MAVTGACRMHVTVTLALHLQCCLFDSWQCRMACTRLSHYFKSLPFKTKSISIIKVFFGSFLHKQLLLCSDVDWQIGCCLILITYFMFGASIWAASERTNSFIVTVCQEPACKCKVLLSY